MQSPFASESNYAQVQMRQAAIATLRVCGDMQRGGETKTFTEETSHDT